MWGGGGGIWDRYRANDVYSRRLDSAFVGSIFPLACTDAVGRHGSEFHRTRNSASP